MNYFTSTGEFKLNLLTELLTDDDFQNQLKAQFAKAKYTISHVGERKLRTRGYVSKLQGEDYRFADTVLKRTIYVPFDVLVEKLRRGFEEFLVDIKSAHFYILLNHRKFDSMALMVCQVLPRRRNFSFVTTKSILPPGSRVVIIDDASYSGTNLTGQIDEITYHNSEATIDVIVPYMSRFTYTYLSKNFPANFYQSELILLMEEYLTERGLPSFSDETYRRFDAIGNLEFHDQLPLYFDHAIGSKDSSFPTIYLQGIVPGGPDHGILIGCEPDLAVRTRVYEAYFDGLLPPPV